ncbi:hypothetical protein ACWC0A_39430 [Streptomyces scopuliridis]
MSFMADSEAHCSDNGPARTYPTAFGQLLGRSSSSEIAVAYELLTEKKRQLREQHAGALTDAAALRSRTSADTTPAVTDY